MSLIEFSQINEHDMNFFIVLSNTVLILLWNEFMATA